MFLNMFTLHCNCPIVTHIKQNLIILAFTFLVLLLNLILSLFIFPCSSPSSPFFPLSDTCSLFTPSLSLTIFLYLSFLVSFFDLLLPSNPCQPLSLTQSLYPQTLQLDIFVLSTYRKKKVFIKEKKNHHSRQKCNSVHEKVYIRMVQNTVCWSLAGCLSKRS